MKSYLALAVAGVVSLTACDNKIEANDKNISLAVANYLDKKGELCLDVTEWPLSVSPYNLESKDVAPDTLVAQMEALKKLGLTAEAPGGNDPNDTNPYKPEVVAIRYVLTDAGKKLYREKEVTKYDYSHKTSKKVIEGDLCYGQKKLAKVVNWTTPARAGKWLFVNVTYVYKIDKVADWAKRPELSAAFPSIAENLAEAGKVEKKVLLKLNEQGWDEYDIGFD
ncbi:hypothetical protein [Massilia sp. CCM 8734]|uniref:hypothetical protein n=1 Tax=Massilia sp. CCM 8734 TaxID=2609283 RepID=UPI0014248025|nr:hypothetical protein [Massilia sp. CCM 8734]NHZ94352.1 hypothetical protein [Massilia sp. CCM 8734]